MNTQQFSEALGEIDSRYIEEALHHRGHIQRLRRMKWGILAACLCLAIGLGLFLPRFSRGLVAGTGLFTITAYAQTPGENGEQWEECELVEGVELLSDSWSELMSSLPGIPFRLSCEAFPDATFELTVDGGEFLLWPCYDLSVEDGVLVFHPIQVDGPSMVYLGSACTAQNGDTLYWQNWMLSVHSGDGLPEIFYGRQAYIDIVVRDGSHIIGYAVIKLYRPDEGSVQYCSALLKSVSFPLVDGSYQDVTEDYVQTQLQQIKAEDRAAA